MKKVLALLALIALAATPALADRSIDGSTVTSDPVSVNAGTVVPVTFYIYNASLDVEWIVSEAGTSTITLPSNLTFVSVDGFLNPSGNDILFSIAGGVLSMDDPDGGWGQIYDGDICEVYTTVDVPADADCGPNVFDWYLFGDIYGDEPHELGGATDFEIVCTTATQSSDWSTLKALY